MPTNTTNYNLVKQGQLEFYNVDVPNSNMDTIDGVLKTLQDAISSGASEQELTTLRNALTTHLADYVKHPGIGTTTNTNNAYAITLEPAPIAYVNGMGLILTINADSTAAATIKVNNLSSMPIKKVNGNPVTNLKAGGVYTLRYSSSAFILQGEGGEYGTATEVDVVAPKTIGTENGIKTGTIIEKNASNGDIAPAYHSPAELSTIPGTIYARPNGIGGTKPTAYKGDTWLALKDPNFLASNILGGKTVFGLAGSLPDWSAYPLNGAYVPAHGAKGDSLTALTISPKPGYYTDGINSGGYGAIILSDPGYIPANIRKGTSIFGVMGTLDANALGARRMAKGTAISGTTGSTPVSVRGLPFRPSTVIIRPVAYTSNPYDGLSVYSDASNVSAVANAGVRVNFGGGAAFSQIATMYADGFDIGTLSSGTNFGWVAYE